MEQVIKIFIYIHAFFGGIALLSGLASILFVKGSPNHKKSGKVFSYGMVISSIISLPICWLPNHENNFLFLIGIFTIYLVISGNRVLLFKKKKEANFTDKLISGVMFVASLFMLFFGTYFLLKSNSGGILFLFFGLTAFLISIRDFKFYKNIDKSKILPFHIGKMTGAYIASVTAFLVAGLRFEGLIYWILPSIIGVFFIIFWTKKVKKA
ncbi:hypothetical protein [uncultured Flavobacterium sp.]|uniref:hypothetical protein n=1 Tax=uncultured Flavobacterium sp. TaxID=165435 RepID=UPI0030ED1938|tara:strand:+ start:53323 stop:53952 length:630 start_codon:yes stop_codon:yes gene_type:complete